MIGMLLATLITLTGAPDPDACRIPMPPGTPEQEAEKFRLTTRIRIGPHGELNLQGPMAPSPGWATTPERVADEIPRAQGAYFNPGDSIMLIVDLDAPYGTVFAVINRLKLARFEKLVIVSPWEGP